MSPTKKLVGRAIYAAFAVLAAIGLLLSVGLHLAVMFRLVDSLENWIWLILGIFVVWPPAVLSLSLVFQGHKREDYGRIAFAGCPLWAQRLVDKVNRHASLHFLLLYAVLGLVIAWTTMGWPIQQGVAVLLQELFPVMLGMAITGVWVFLYATSLAILYSACVRQKGSGSAQLSVEESQPPGPADETGDGPPDILNQ